MKLRDLRLVSDGGWLSGTTMLWKLGVSLTFIGLVAYVVGFSTDWWGVLDHEEFTPRPGFTIDSHFGLWRKCITILNNTEVLSKGCKDMDNDDSYKPAAKTLCSIGLIIAVFALPLVMIAACAQQPRGMIYGGAIIIIAAIIAIVGGSVYIGKALEEEDRLEVDYSVFLAMGGPVVMTIGGFLQLFSVKSGYHSIA